MNKIYPSTACAARTYQGSGVLVPSANFGGNPPIGTAGDSVMPGAPIQRAVLLSSPVMVRECAWCIREQGLPPTPGASHGMCDGHAAALRAELERFKAEQPTEALTA